MVGDRLSNYRILSRAGQGRTGTVYLAERMSDGRRVALKIVHPEIASDPSRVADLLVATYGLRQIDHPAIPRVLEILHGPDTVGIVTEWIDGEALADRLLLRPPAPAEMARIGAAVAGAVAAAHEKGLCGFEIDTSHILIEDSGRARMIGLEPETSGEGRPSRHGRHGDLASIGAVLRGMARGQERALLESEGIYAVCETGAQQGTYRAARDVADDLHARARRPTGNPRRWITAAAIAFLCSLVLVAVFGTAPRAGLQWPGSLAVLPLSVDSDAGRVIPEHFGLRVADAIITTLGEIGRVRVRPTGSVERFAMASGDPLGAGRALDVEHVLSGVVVLRQGAVRIRLELLDVRSGESEWAETLSFGAETEAEMRQLEQRVIETVLRRLDLPRRAA